MAKCSGCSSVFHEDSDCLLITGDGTSSDPLTITPIIDPDPINLLSCGTDGFLVSGVEDIAVFSRNDSIDVGTGVGRFLFPFDAAILQVTAAVNTAPTGSDIILDVNKNGTTLFINQANRPRILAGAFQTASPAIPDVTAILTGDYITVDRDQIGSIIPGSDLTVFVLYWRV